jgi:hypothetical protein
LLLSLFWESIISLNKRILGILGVPERVIQRRSSHETKRVVTEKESSPQQERNTVEKDKSM